jgi:hypothetical protein
LFELLDAREVWLLDPRCEECGQTLENLIWRRVWRDRDRLLT